MEQLRLRPINYTMGTHYQHFGVSNYIVWGKVAEIELVGNPTLKELAAAGAISGIRLVGQSDGFALFVRYGMTEKVLQAKRGHIRRFKSLERAVGFVRALGIARVEVDVTNWAPRQRSL